MRHSQLQRQNGERVTAGREGEWRCPSTRYSIVGTTDARGWPTRLSGGPAGFGFRYIDGHQQRCMEP
jgi:hypothetical protein